MNSSIKKAQALTVTELTAMGAAQLMQVQKEVAEHYKQAKALKDWVDGAIAMKYTERAQAYRRQAGKDTGTVHFEDAGVRISANLPKRPVWDQPKLAEIADRLRDSDENPNDFMQISYKFPERRYNDWTESLRQLFEPARTIKTGKPTFELSIPNTEPCRSSASLPSYVQSPTKEYA